jgi:uncharacterized protein (TIGR03086 family)
MLSEDPAERHRQAATRFGEIAAEVPDWDAPSPVPEWAARDVVGHLVEWFPGFLAGGGIVVETIPDGDDPAARWAAHAAVVQALFDDGDREFTHPHVGTHRLADAINQFYTSDIFMHSWDLARSGDIDPELDQDFAAMLLTGMEPLDDMLRASGQYGPKVEVAAEEPAVDRLMAFVGRDPAWSPAVRSV